MLEQIEEIKRLREEKQKIENRERELLEPALTDLSMLPVLYGWIRETLADMPQPPDPESVEQRKKFLFAVIALYCPGVFSGDKMPEGLRDALSRLVSVDKSIINKNISNLLFFCEKSRFCEDNSVMIEKIVQRLEKIAQQLRRCRALFAQNFD